MPIRETKAFWCTSEFWITALMALGAIVAALADILPPQYAAFIAVLSSACYTLSRGIAKSGNPVAVPPVIVEENLVRLSEEKVVCPGKQP